MENPRTTSARDHDDHEIIDAAGELPTPGAIGGGGGGIADDVNSQEDLAQVADPEHHEGVTRSTAIHNDQSFGNPARGRGQNGD
jgi:N-acetylglucosamine-6-phosphate deacetylase